MITIKWTVSNLKVAKEMDNQKDVVIAADYEVSGSDGIDTAAVKSAENFRIDPTELFIPYEKLTNDIIVSWIQKANPEFAKNYERNIEAQLKAMKKPEPVIEDRPVPNQ